MLLNRQYHGTWVQQRNRRDQHRKCSPDAAQRNPGHCGADGAAPDYAVRCIRAKNSRRHREPTDRTTAFPRRSTVIREPGKVRKDGGHQIAMMGIVRSQPRGVQIEDVARLGGGFRP